MTDRPPELESPTILCLIIHYLFVSDHFDAAQIAGKLKSIAESLNDNVAFRTAVDDFKKEAAHVVSFPHQALHSS